MAQAAAVFHIGMAKGGPPLPDGLSPECRDFLNLCFNRFPLLPFSACLSKDKGLRQAISRVVMAVPNAHMCQWYLSKYHSIPIWQPEAARFRSAMVKPLFDEQDSCFTTPTLRRR